MNNNLILQNMENISTSSLSVTSSEVDINREIEAPAVTEAAILREKVAVSVGKTDDERQGLVSARVSLFECQTVKAESNENLHEKNGAEKSAKNPVETGNRQSLDTSEPVKTSYDQQDKTSNDQTAESSEPVETSNDQSQESSEPVVKSNDQSQESSEPVKNSNQIQENSEPVKTSEQVDSLNDEAASDQVDSLEPVETSEESVKLVEPDPVFIKEDQLEEKEICEGEEEIYPDDLNPFGDEEDKKTDEEIKNVSSNPFGSDGEDEEAR